MSTDLKIYNNKEDITRKKQKSRSRLLLSFLLCVKTTLGVYCSFIGYHGIHARQTDSLTQTHRHTRRGRICILHLYCFLVLYLFH
jgi:hypothetical protein